MKNITKGLTKLRNKLVISVTVAIVSLVFLVITSISLAREQNKVQTQNQYNQLMHSSIEHVIKHFVKDYNYRVKQIVNTTDISTLVENKDRKALFDFLNPKFKLMQEESKHFEVMQVHLADGTSFLRLHKPKFYGDNIAKKRIMLQEIHANHQAISAYETGEFATVYRIVYPIFNKQEKYLGALEFGLNPNYIVDAIHHINGFDGVVFINQKELKLHSLPNSIVVDGYKLQTNVNENLKSLCDEINASKKLINNQKIKIEDKTFLTHLIVLKNYVGKESVKMMFFQDITRQNIFFSRLQVLIYISAFLGLLLLIALVQKLIKEYQEKVSVVYKNYITRLQKNEEKIKNSQKYHQALFDTIPNILIATNGEFIKDANSAMLDFFGFDTLEEFSKKHKCICEFFLQEKDCLLADMGQYTWVEYIQNNQDKVHKVYMKKDGKEYHFLVNLQKLDYDEHNRNLVSFVDITELEYLNTRLEIAVNGTNDGLWDWDLVTNEIYFSPQWKKQLGYEDDELTNALETWESLAHPDDKDLAEKNFKANIAGETDLYENIHRLRHKDGYWVWILDRGQTQFNQENKPIRMVGFHTDITRQKELEEKLRRSQNQFESFMEHIPADIVIKDKAHRIVYANQRMKKFLGDEEIVGKKADELFSGQVLEKINFCDAKAIELGVYEELLEVAVSEQSVEVFRNITFKMQDQYESGLGVISLNITNEYKAQKGITRLLSAFERSDISVVMTDVDANIEYVNPSWCKITGYTKEELIGENPRIVKSDSTSKEHYLLMWDRISSGKVWNSEIENIAKDGSAFWESSTIVPSFDENENVSGYIAFKLDITDKIAIRKKLKEQEELMLSQSRHAAMGEMISMIAHQWRQPISVIAMDANNILVDIELEAIEEDSLRNDVSDIVEQTKHLSKTIDDFRNFFKPNKIKDNVLVSDVFDEAFNVINKSLENNNILVENSFHSTTKVEIFSRELLQVLLNILKNAKEVLIEKRAEDRKIVNTIFEDENAVIIKICDNAGGAKDDVLSRIFEPYFTTKDEKNGTGLGLYMSKTIVEKHLFGSIEAFNLDNGLCFTIKIPKRVKTNE